MIRKKTENKIHVIQLDGPNGNAFNLLGMALSLSRQLGFSKEDSEAIQKEMMSGDYENLLEVFDREFGSVVILER